MSQRIFLSATSPSLLALSELHRDLANALNKLSSIEDQDFCNEYKHFVALAEQVFRREEEWLEQNDLPAFKYHQEQHARALGALHHVHRRVMDGEIELGREVADKLLPQWIAFHMSSMDDALARAMQMDLPESHQSESSAAGPLH
jgi:hemerythrin